MGFTLAALAAKWLFVRQSAARWWNPSLAFALATVVLCLGSALGVLWWGEHRAHERDQLWRQRIAAANAEVRVKMRLAGDAARVTDDEIITALEATDDQLARAEHALKARTVYDATCPNVPARCLGLRDPGLDRAAGRRAGS